MAGGNEKVIPILVGIVIFALLLSFIVANLGPISGNENTPTTSGGGLSITGTHDSWSPGSRAITWHNVTNYYNLYPWHSENFTHVGKHEMTVFVIRNSTQYNPGSQNMWMLYRNYIIVDEHSLGLWPKFAVSFATISALANQTPGTSNVSLNFNANVPTPTNFTLFIETGAGGFQANLWTHDRFNLTLSEYTPPSGPSTSTDVLTTLWWVLTLNVNWLPTYPIIVYMVGIVLDLAIVLCVIRILW